jgi:hypothetical protein
MDAGVRARGGEETSAVSVDATWQQFVAENILFYTSLLKLLLLRSLVEFSTWNVFHRLNQCVRKGATNPDPELFFLAGRFRNNISVTFLTE